MPKLVSNIPDPQTIEVASGDLLIPFRCRPLMEISLDKILELIDNNSDEKIQEFIDWANNYMGNNFIHQTEYEWIFPLVGKDKSFLKAMKVPEDFQFIFEAFFDCVKNFEKKNKSTLELRVFYNKPNHLAP